MPGTHELLERLLEAWSEANLNKIARNLIRLYQKKQFEKLNIISGLISEWVEIDINTEIFLRSSPLFRHSPIKLP